MAKVISFAPLCSDPQIYTPTKLIMREKQLQNLFDIYGKIKKGYYPHLICLSGPKAFGKTVTVLHFIKELQARGESLCVYLSCKSTLRKSARSLLKRVSKERTDVIDRIVEKGSLIFFDDVHNVAFNKFDLNMFNLEIKYFYDTYKSKATPVFMTNMPLRALKQCFTDEVLSRMSWPLGTFINFPSYNLNEMYQILVQRCREALAPNSWDESAVLKCAKYGAENKDMRLAIDLLRDACQTKSDRLETEHVEKALEKQGVESLSNDLENLPLYDRLYLLSQTLEEKRGYSEKGVSLNRLDTTFQKICEHLDVSLISRQTRWKMRQKLELEQLIDTHLERRVVPDAMGKPRAGSTVYVRLTIPASTLLRAFQICSWDDVYEPEKMREIFKGENV